MSKPMNRNIPGIKPSDIGIRHWLRYVEPFEFNITVNEMTNVLKHEDAELRRSNNYGIQSSADSWNYHVVTTGKSKRL